MSDHIKQLLRNFKPGERPFSQWEDRGLDFTGPDGEKRFLELFKQHAETKAYWDRFRRPHFDLEPEMDPAESMESKAFERALSDNFLTPELHQEALDRAAFVRGQDNFFEKRRSLADFLKRLEAGDLPDGGDGFARVREFYASQRLTPENASERSEAQRQAFNDWLDDFSQHDHEHAARAQVGHTLACCRRARARRIEASARDLAENSFTAESLEAELRTLNDDCAAFEPGADPADFLEITAVNFGERLITLCLKKKRIREAIEAARVLGGAAGPEKSKRLEAILAPALDDLNRRGRLAGQLFHDEAGSLWDARRGGAADGGNAKHLRGLANWGLFPREKVERLETDLRAAKRAGEIFLDGDAGEVGAGYDRPTGKAIVRLRGLYGESPMDVLADHYDDILRNVLGPLLPVTRAAASFIILGRAALARPEGVNEAMLERPLAERYARELEQSFDSQTGLEGKTKIAHEMDVRLGERGGAAVMRQIGLEMREVWALRLSRSRDARLRKIGRRLWDISSTNAHAQDNLVNTRNNKSFSSGAESFNRPADEKTPAPITFQTGGELHAIGEAGQVLSRLERGPGLSQALWAFSMTEEELLAELEKIAPQPFRRADEILEHFQNERFQILNEPGAALILPRGRGVEPVALLRGLDRVGRAHAAGIWVNDRGDQVMLVNGAGWTLTDESGRELRLAWAEAQYLGDCAESEFEAKLAEYLTDVDDETFTVYDRLEERFNDERAAASGLEEAPVLTAEPGPDLEPAPDSTAGLVGEPQISTESLRPAYGDEEYSVGR